MGFSGMVLCAPVSFVSWRARAAGWLFFRGLGRGGGGGKESSPCCGPNEIYFHLSLYKPINLTGNPVPNWKQQSRPYTRPHTHLP